MSDNGQQVPLIERLQRVPEGAVWVETVAEHDMRGVGYAYTQNHPVGALCREAADRIEKLGATLAAERERREEAEMALAGWRRWARSACARYEKEPT